MKRLANRTKELQQFERMLRRDVRERILLIEAPSGYGKSGLMERFQNLCPSGVQAVSLDLKAAQLGISYVFSRIQRVLGKQRFPNFNQAIANFLNSGVEINHNRLTGEGNKIQVILDVSPQERQYRLSQIQQVFFEDLEKFNRPIAFLFDTFNGATPELAEWIEGYFLTEVALNPKLLAIVAGQNIPKPIIDWQNYHHCCRLDPIKDVEAWYLYCQEVGFGFTPVEIKMVIDGMQGVPLRVVEYLEIVALTRQQL